MAEQTQTRELSEKIDEILLMLVEDFRFSNAGVSERLEYGDQILQACKEAGLKFTETTGATSESDDTKWYKLVTITGEIEI